MTVENQFPYQSFTANGLQTNFTLDFYVNDKNHFEVKNNGQVVSKNNYNYDNSSNSIVFNTIPIQGDLIEVQRSTTADRAITYETYNNTFRPETLNHDLDRIWLKIQELGVADHLLKVYTDKLHLEQKEYIDSQDELIKQIINDLSGYVDDQDLKLELNIDDLREDLEQKILKQGVALDQLEDYYNAMIETLRNIAVDQKWFIDLVVDPLTGQSQSQINDLVNTQLKDRYTKAQVDQALNEKTDKTITANIQENKADRSNTYTKNEVDQKIGVGTGGKYGFKTIADFTNQQSTIPINSVVTIAEAGANQGDNIWDGTTLTKSYYDPLPLATGYTDDKTKQFSQERLTGYQYTWTCPHPTNSQFKLVAGGIKEDGAIHFKAADFDNLTTDVSTIQNAIVQNLTVDNAINGTLSAYPKIALDGYVSNVFDKDMKAAGGIKEDGTIHYLKAQFEYINGQKTEDLFNLGTKLPTFDGEIIFVANCGQSLSQGPYSVKTTIQEYDTIAFTAHSTNPTSWSPATTATASAQGNKEIPTLGATALVKQLIKTEDGISHTEQSYQQLIGNSAYGGQAIAALSKGGSTGAYEEIIGQVRAGYNLAQAANKMFIASCTYWVQGEGDYWKTQENYYNSLRQYAKNFDEDCRQITGQSRPVYLIASQTTSWGQTDYNRNVQLAMLQAQADDPRIVVSAPQYMYSYLDDTYYAHVNGTHTRLIGAYQGLAYKRTIIDGKKWQPLMPISIKAQGKVVFVKFNKTNLKIDTTLVPPQQNYGFSIRDNVGTENNISSVQIVQPDTIKIVCNSTITKGSVLWIGGKTATGIPNYLGGASNIRDSQGDEIKFDNYPLHNWAVIYKGDIN